MTHDVLTFSQALERVRASQATFRNGQSFFDFLDALTAPLDDKAKRSLSVLLVTYSFGQLILSDGVALDPKGQPLPAEYLISNQTPFGVVLDNSCEVLESVVLSDKVVDTSQALLRRGYFIGLFELCDYILEAAGPETPDWTISAGARTMQFVEMPTNQTRWDDLRRRHHVAPPYHDNRVTNFTPLQVIDAVPKTRQACQEWRVSVLFFSREWAELIKSQYYDPVATGTAMLAHSLVDVGWRGVARIRDSSGMLYDVLREWGGSDSTVQVEAAHLLIERCRDVLLGRRPCYVPVTTNDDLGPFEAMVDVMRDAGIKHPCVFRPTYLEAGQLGFLPLAHIIPDAFIRDRKDDLLKVLHIVSLAKAKAKQMNKRIPALDVEHLFPHIAFRVRTGGAQSVSKFLLDPATFQPKAVSRDEYYGPFFASARPRPGCPFFHVAVRIKRPSGGGHA